MTTPIYQRLLGGLVLLMLLLVLWRLLLPGSIDTFIDRQTQIPLPPHFERYEVAKPYQINIEREKALSSSSANHLATDVVSEPSLDEQGLPVAWVVQVASFRSATHAEALVQQLRDQGYTAYTHVVSTQAGDRIRVYVGPVVSKHLADLDKQAIDKLLATESIVVRFEGPSG